MCFKHIAQHKRMLDVLQAAEQHRKSLIDEALLQATQAMNDIAHLSPGEVERLIEQQALDLNLSMLDNRYAACAHHELDACIVTSIEEVQDVTWHVVQACIKHYCHWVKSDPHGYCMSASCLLHLCRAVSRNSMMAFKPFASHLNQIR